MLEVERVIGKTLEKDFEEKYVKSGWGQKRLAQRWGVSRNLIFSLNMHGGRQSWAQKLGLKVRRIEDKLPVIKKRSFCEISPEHDAPPDKAHWIARKDGGDSSCSNILLLCPNCHRKLDRDNKKVTRQAKETLLFRETKKVIEKTKSDLILRKELLILTEQIIYRKKIK